MSELKKCGICGAVSIRKDGHIFHKTDDCIRNLEARILELRSKISRLVEVGDKICEEARLQDPFTDEEGMAILEAWNKEAHE